MNARTKLASLKPFALVCAGVIAGSMFSEFLRPSPALAQNRSDNRDDGKSLPPSEVLNAGDQRKQILMAINQIGDRVGRIETALNTGIKVKVTEMPPVVMKETK